MKHYTYKNHARKNGNFYFIVACALLVLLLYYRNTHLTTGTQNTNPTSPHDANTDLPFTELNPQHNGDSNLSHTNPTTQRSTNTDLPHTDLDAQHDGDSDLSYANPNAQQDDNTDVLEINLSTHHGVRTQNTNENFSPVTAHSDSPHPDAHHNKNNPNFAPTTQSQLTQPAQPTDQSKNGQPASPAPGLPVHEGESTSSLSSAHQSTHAITPESSKSPHIASTAAAPTNASTDSTANSLTTSPALAPMSGPTNTITTAPNLQPLPVATTVDIDIDSDHAAPSKIPPRLSSPQNTAQSIPQIAQPSPTINNQQKPAPQSSSPMRNQKTVRITNNITPKMLQYKHWSGKYTPTLFIITANGTPLETDQTTPITVTNNKLDLRFEYEFMNGKRTGDKTVPFTLKNDTSAIDLTFSWKEEDRFIVDEIS